MTAEPQGGEYKPINWINICRGVCELVGCTPAEFGQMTLAEIVCCCIDLEDERKRANATPMELARYVEWWSGLTPEQRLWAEADA